MYTYNFLKEKCIGFNQNNPHHDFTLDIHIDKAVQFAIDNNYSENVIEALRWHDFGKLLETDITCLMGYNHYNYHNLYSAELYWENKETYNKYIHDLIINHNNPLTKKLYKKFGYEYCLDLIDMKTADTFAHKKEYETTLHHLSVREELLNKLYEIKKEDVIKQRLEDDYERLEKLGYEVVGVFLQGSQNYRLDTPKSDIDTKAIVLPSIDDVINNKQPISTTMVLEDNSHLDVKDIRVMFEQMKKCNINFLEILFTRYKKLNKNYSLIFAELLKNKEKMAKCNELSLLNSICGMSLEKKKALTHPYPSIIDKIEKYGYDPKQIHHIARLEKFIKNYVYGKSFGKSLIVLGEARKFLINIKNGTLTLPEAVKLADDFCAEIKSVKDRFIEIEQNSERDIGFKPDIASIYDNVKSEIIKEYWRKEFRVC